MKVGMAAQPHKREIDEVERQGGRVFLHLGARRDLPRG
jgi:hypothetical protein